MRGWGDKNYCWLGRFFLSVSDIVPKMLQLFSESSVSVGESF